MLTFECAGRPSLPTFCRARSAASSRESGGSGMSKREEELRPRSASATHPYPSNPERLVQPCERYEGIAAGEDEAVDAGRRQRRFEILGTSCQVDALGACRLERGGGRRAEIGIDRIGGAKAGDMRHRSLRRRRRQPPQCRAVRIERTRCRPRRGSWRSTLRARRRSRGRRGRRGKLQPVAPVRVSVGVGGVAKRLERFG